MRFVTFIGLPAMALGLAGPDAVQAATLFEGKQVAGEYSFGQFPGRVIRRYAPRTVSGPTLLTSRLDSTAASLVVSDRNILIDYEGSAIYGVYPFNGVRIFDFAGTIAAIGGVTINAATNLAGFDISRVTFSSDSIYVNLQGLRVNADTIISIDVAPAAVPEPANWTMMIAGFAAVGKMARRRRMPVRVAFGRFAD
jgi:hypothetical protein